jgi:hypothetical protein
VDRELLFTLLVGTGLGVLAIVTTILVVSHRHERQAFCRAWATRPFARLNEPIFVPALYTKCLSECADWAGRASRVG